MRSTSPERPPERVRSTPSRRVRALLAAASVVLTGCAYSFSGSSLPSHIKSVGVPTFANETLQPGLETEMTEAAIDVFLDDQRLNVGGGASADAVVEGRIVSYDNRVFGVGNVDQAQEYRVTIRIAVTVKDRVKGKDLWSRDTMVGQSVYRLDGGGSGPADEDEARLEAVEKLARDILSNTLEEW